MKKILIIGKRGQLGSHLMQQNFAGEVISFGRDGIDLLQTNQIYDWVVATQADIIINAAAYTDTQKAEAEPEVANLINAVAVGELARAAKTLSALFIHVSTDYVFDGTQTTPYSEQDTVNPVSVYGQSKLLGEQLALKNHDKTVIIRTSWVFSELGKNFVKTIVAAAQKNTQLEVVSDQVGSPTYAGHLAQHIASLCHQYIQSQQTVSPFPVGCYHYADAPACSWYEFAQEIVVKARVNGFSVVVERINPVLASNWPSPITRPAYAVLDCAKFRQDFGLSQQSWQQGLLTVLKKLAEAQHD